LPEEEGRSHVRGSRIAAKNGNVHTILWVIAVVLVIAGIIAILRRSIIFGIVLIIAGFLIGPGGVSIFK